MDVIRGVRVLKMYGELAAENSEVIWRALDTVLCAREDRVIIDFSGVCSMDSALAGFFVCLWKRLKRDNRDLLFYQPCKAVADQMSRTSLGSAIQCIDTPRTLTEAV